MCVCKEETKKSKGPNILDAKWPNVMSGLCGKGC